MAENESLDPLKAEAIGLCEIEKEAARIRLAYTEEVGLGTLMNSIDWIHRI